MDRQSQINEFLAGRLSEDEVKNFIQWINSPEGKRFLSEESQKVWEEEEWDTEDFPEWEGKRVWDKILVSQGIPAVRPSATTVRRLRLPIWFKVACSFLLVAVVAWSIFSLVDAPGDKGSAENREHKIISRYNPPGQKSKIHLPDGSILFLNADSRVEYSSDFEKNRHVKLEGEAFFTVTKDSLNPFTVDVGGITTRVLGTSFNVSSYSPEDKVQVTLVSGRISLAKYGEEVITYMHPGEETLISQSEPGFTKTTVDVTKRISWVSGVLEFEKTSLDYMIDILERWYGVEIMLNGPVPEVLSSGTFENNETLPNVLNVLGSTIGFNYEIKGKEVTISFN